MNTTTAKCIDSEAKVLKCIVRHDFARLKKTMKNVVLLVAIICASELFAIPINPDYSCKAVAAYKAKADAGDAESQYLYAHALFTGEGIPSDKKLAFDYAIKAAKGGCKYSLYLVGQGTKDGWKQQPDSKKAESFF